MEEIKSNVVVISTLTVTYFEKDTKRSYVDKSTYGFVHSNFTKGYQEELTKLIKEGMEKTIEDYYGKEYLKERFSKIGYKFTFQIKEVDYIIQTD